MGTTLAELARLEVDLGAVVANWRQCLQRHGGAVAAVLKADAYGLGAAAVAPALHRAGCQTFFTAHLAEALAIRPLLPGAVVAVLNGLLPGDEATFVAHDIQPVLGSLDEIARWGAAARMSDRALPALLHVDTGMNRLGLDARELAVLQADHGRLAGIAVGHVMTHLAAADQSDDPMNATQLARFAAACERLPPAPRSLANSSGILLGPAFRSDLARPGAALYGLNPTAGAANPMATTVRLQARVLSVRPVGRGESVGYNAIWRAARDSRIATIGVGYADGWLRSLSNQGEARFDGAAVPLVGGVSMDLTTFDVTDQPAIEPGSWLELIGPHCPPDAVAVLASTNGYEILTSLGRRYAQDLSRVNPVLNGVEGVGRAALGACRATGRLALFAATGLSHLLRPPFHWRMFLRALVEIGFFSLLVVALTAIFTGMVLALQSSTGLSRFSADSAVASLVVLSVTRELGPVLAGLMVAGRVGAAMAAEIGTMRVTDQIDALSTLSTDPMKYLVTPRLLAGLVALPLLVVVADILGVLGGFIVATVKLGFNREIYLANTLAFLQTDDVVSGLAKAAMFGFLIALMGCFHGYNSRGGAQGVGAATTSAVVGASVLILAFDYVLTELFFAR